MKPTDYINGRRRGREARRVELEAMRDPLLHDALEGFDAVTGDHGEAIRRLLERVDAKVAERPRSRGRVMIRRWSAVAAVVLLCVAVGGLYMILGGHEQTVYSDVLMPAEGRPVDFRVLESVEYVIRIEKGNVSPEAVRSDSSPVRAMLDQSGVPAIGEVTQAQLDSLMALDSFGDFVDSNMAITTDALGVRVSGRAVAEFTVGDDGRPRRIRIIESPAPAASREAVRLIRSAPEWPNGMTIRVEVDF